MGVMEEGERVRGILCRDLREKYPGRWGNGVAVGNVRYSCCSFVMMNLSAKRKSFFLQDCDRKTGNDKYVRACSCPGLG